MKWIKAQFNYIRNRIQFWYFRNEADRMHKITGKRYFVIPNGKTLKVVDNDYVKLYNRAAAKLNYKKVTIVDLLHDCYYCTQMGTTGSRKRKSFNKQKPKTIFEKI